MFVFNSGGLAQDIHLVQHPCQGSYYFQLGEGRGAVANLELEGTMQFETGILIADIILGGSGNGTVA